MIAIDFITEKVVMPQFNQEVVKSWIEAVAHSHGKNVGRLTYVFCDDEYILATNRQYLGHDYYTDIITFDYSNSRRIGGDLVISLDTVLSNSQQFARSYEEELMRVMIHGVLHLCGINDKGPGEREIMEHCENEALAIVPTSVFSK